MARPAHGGQVLKEKNDDDSDRHDSDGETATIRQQQGRAPQNLGIARTVATLRSRRASTSGNLNGHVPVEKLTVGQFL